MTVQYPFMNKRLRLEHHQSRINDAQQASQIRALARRHSNPIMQANRLSLTFIVLSLVALIAFFIMSAQPVTAQDRGIDIADYTEQVQGKLLWSHLFDAVAAIEVEDYATAIQHLDAALELDRGSVEAYLLASYVTLQQDHPAVAYLNAQIAYYVDPDNTAAYFFNAEAQCELGNLADAQFYYDEYLSRVHQDGIEPFIIRTMLEIDSYAVIAARPIECTSASPQS